MYSFSTCWNSHRHTDGAAMLREMGMAFWLPEAEQELAQAKTLDQ